MAGLAGQCGQGASARAEQDSTGGQPKLWWQMPTELPPRYPPPIPRPPILVDAIMAMGIALIVVVSANFLFWLTS